MNQPVREWGARIHSDGYIPTLDGWRAVAVVAVIVCHGSDAVFSRGGVFPSAFWHELTRYGALGVDVFFGISGYLICTKLLEGFDRHGHLSLRSFYLRRSCRILPPYAMYLMALAAFAWAGWVSIDSRELLSCVFFVRNYVAPHSIEGWYTAHFWSLAVEEHFYLLFPGLLVLATPQRTRWMVAVIALLLAAWRVLEFRYQLVAQLLPDAAFYERTDIRLDALLLGCWAALLVSKWRARLTEVFTPAIWSLAVALFVWCVIATPPLAMLWQALLVPAMLVGTTLRPDTSIGRVLEHGSLRWIGRISYSLYVWQQLFLVGQGAPHISVLGVWQSWPLNLLASFGCATVSYYCIERPMIRVGYRLTGQSVPGRVATTAIGRLA